MSKIGDELNAFDELFAEWFEDELVITNYVAVDAPTDHDEWDDPNDKQEASDSPITTSGQIDPLGAVAESEPWARDIDADVVVFVDEDTTISDGEQPGMPYPSEVTRSPAGAHRSYRITQIIDEGNGVLRCLATTLPYRGES